MTDTFDLLAIIALRRWAYDRAALRSARTTNYKTTGWQKRSNRLADARIVRVVDFERTLGMLTPTQQQELLTLVYRHGHNCSEAAALMRSNPESAPYQTRARTQQTRPHPRPPRTALSRARDNTASAGGLAALPLIRILKFRGVVKPVGDRRVVSDKNPRGVGEMPGLSPNVNVFDTGVNIKARRSAGGGIHLGSGSAGRGRAWPSQQQCRWGRQNRCSSPHRVLCRTAGSWERQ